MVAGTTYEQVAVALAIDILNEGMVPVDTIAWVTELGLDAEEVINAASDIAAQLEVL